LEIRFTGCFGRCTRLSSYAHQGKVLQVTSASFKARRVNPKNFFTELKRRHIHKVAIAYKPSFAIDSG
jgi:hypothetical protein